MSYFMVSCSEDGDVSVCEMDERELKSELNNRPHRSVDLDAEGSDPMYWAGGCIIIKGEIVKPKPVQKVTEWEV